SDLFWPLLSLTHSHPTANIVRIILLALLPLPLPDPKILSFGPAAMPRFPNHLSLLSPCRSNRGDESLQMRAAIGRRTKLLRQQRVGDKVPLLSPLSSSSLSSLSFWLGARRLGWGMAEVATVRRLMVDLEDLARQRTVGSGKEGRRAGRRPAPLALLLVHSMGADSSGIMVSGSVKGSSVRFGN
ncbi:unnamed protein product, partial [Urochloa humidicola]